RGGKECDRHGERGELAASDAGHEDDLPDPGRFGGRCFDGMDRPARAAGRGTGSGRTRRQAMKAKTRSQSAAAPTPKNTTGSIPVAVPPPGPGVAPWAISAKSPSAVTFAWNIETTPTGSVSSDVQVPLS